MYCVYRFIDKEGDIIYVGKTKHLKKRMTSQHFTIEGHLPRRAYEETDRVEYTELPTEMDMGIVELYYINRYKPKYNVQSKQVAELSLKIDEGHRWREYVIRKDNYTRDLEERYLALRSKCRRYEDEIKEMASSKSETKALTVDKAGVLTISDMKMRFLMSTPIRDN